MIHDQWRALDIHMAGHPILPCRAAWPAGVSCPRCKRPEVALGRLQTNKVHAVVQEQPLA